MSGQYPVTATVTPIYPSGQQTATTVKNIGDKTVYLGTSNSLSAMSGYALGPGSAIGWDANKPLYAVCAAGDSSTLNALDNGGGLFDASAVASQILAQGLANSIATDINRQGVPNIFLNDLLYNSYVPPGAAIAPGGSITLDIYKYGSLHVKLPTSGAISVVQLDFYEDDPTTVPAYTCHLTNVDSALTGLASPAWQIPINAATVVITNLGTQPQPVQVFASNRTVPRLSLLGDNIAPRVFSFSGNVTANNAYDLVSADAGNNSTTFNGPVLLAWNTNFTTANAVTGEMIFATNNGILSSALELPAFTGNANQTFNHPSVPCKWRFFTTQTLAGAAVTLWIIPSQSG